MLDFDPIDAAYAMAPMVVDVIGTPINFDGPLGGRIFGRLTSIRAAWLDLAVAAENEIEDAAARAALDLDANRWYDEPCPFVDRHAFD